MPRNNEDTMEYVRQERKVGWNKLRDIENLAAPWVAPSASWKLQWYMRRLVAEESDETKQRMYTKFSNLIENPTIQDIDEKPSVSVQYRAGELPMEIMVHILKMCTIEDCVVLRQVSSA